MIYLCIENESGCKTLTMMACERSDPNVKGVKTSDCGISRASLIRVTPRYKQDLFVYSRYVYFDCKSEWKPDGPKRCECYILRGTEMFTVV